MTRAAVAALLAGLGAACASTSPPAPAPSRAVLGGAPPALAGPVLNPTLSGQARYALAEALRAEKIVVLDFGASYCDPCWMQLPLLQTLAARYAETGVEVVMVVVDEEPEGQALAAEAVRERFKVAFPVVADVDGRLAEAFGADQLPTLWLVDREGRLAWHEVGFKGDTIEQLEARLDAMTRP